MSRTTEQIVADEYADHGDDAHEPNNTVWYSQEEVDNLSHHKWMDTIHEMQQANHNKLEQLRKDIIEKIKEQVMSERSYERIIYYVNSVFNKHSQSSPTSNHSSPDDNSVGLDTLMCEKHNIPLSHSGEIYYCHLCDDELTKNMLG